MPRDPALTGLRAGATPDDDEDMSAADELADDEHTIEMIRRGIPLPGVKSYDDRTRLLW